MTARVKYRLFTVDMCMSQSQRIYPFSHLPYLGHSSLHSVPYLNQPFSQSLHIFPLLHLKCSLYPARVTGVLSQCSALG